MIYDRRCSVVVVYVSAVVVRALLLSEWTAEQRALDIKRSIHGIKNLAVATAEEDLSYALYVLEYSSGNFQSAKDHICKSIEILRSLLPTDHLLLSSARRVKALILEEIALDNFIIGDNHAGMAFCLILFSCLRLSSLFAHRLHLRLFLFLLVNRKSKPADRSRGVASVRIENYDRCIRRGERANCQALWQPWPFVSKHGEIWGE